MLNTIENKYFSIKCFVGLNRSYIFALAIGKTINPKEKSLKAL